METKISLCTTELEGIITSMDDVLSGLEGDKGTEATADEYNSTKEKDVFEIVDCM